MSGPGGDRRGAARLAATDPTSGPGGDPRGAARPAATDPVRRPGTRPLPAGALVHLAPGAQRPGPGVLCGGSPWRAFRLRPAGDRLLDAWMAGRPVGREGLGTERAAGLLAGRLFDAGLLGLTAPAPATGPVGAGGDLAVVLPVRDRPAGVAATLGALGAAAAEAAVVVVDDGSLRPEEVAAAATVRPGTRLLRREVCGGPGAARNSGWRAVEADVVVFLDADCVPPPGWLAAVIGQFSDPALGALAPRIVADPAGAPTCIGVYEAHHSPLDLGEEAGPVRPGSRVAYVPSAALAVRSAALVALDGFDETLRWGEDVDLVWRMERAGWRVRYDPAVAVAHPVRPTLAAFAAQRVGYGRSAAPLAARHKAAVAPISLDPALLAAGVLAATRRPFAGACVAAAVTAAALRPLRRGTPPLVDALGLARLVARSQLGALHATLGALRRPWWPAVGGALLLSAAVAPGAPGTRGLRRGAVALATVPPLVDWARRRPPLDPLRWCALATVDDAAYGVGVWLGAVRARSPRCLVPAWRRRLRADTGGGTGRRADTGGGTGRRADTGGGTGRRAGRW